MARSASRSTAAAMAAPTLTDGLVDEVERRADDRLGVDPRVAIEVLDVARLPEVRHAERGERRPAHAREEAQRVRMAVEDRDHRRAPGRGEQLVEDRVIA